MELNLNFILKCHNYDSQFRYYKLIVLIKTLLDQEN